MTSETSPETRNPSSEVYERPSVVDLGTFAELTLHRTNVGLADNSNKNGTM